MHYHTTSKVYHITPTMRRICKPLVRRSYNSFAVQCVRRNRGTKHAIVKVMGEVLHKEVAAICSHVFNSITRQKSIDPVQNFKNVLTSINDKLKHRAPTFLKVTFNQITGFPAIT